MDAMEYVGIEKDVQLCGPTELCPVDVERYTNNVKYKSCMERCANKIKCNSQHNSVYAK